MKNLLILLTSLFIWYALTSFVLWNVYIYTWHFTARLLFTVFTLLTYDKVSKTHK